MTISMAGYVTNDAIMKLVGPDLGLAQSIFIRGLFCSGLIICIFLITTKQLSDLRCNFVIVIGRSILDLLATIFFLTALLNMPFANVNAILQALPLTVAIAASIILKETFGRKRTLAILIGLGGVLLIIKPGTDGFNYYSVLAILAVLSVTFRDLLTRKIPYKVPGIFIALSTSVMVTGSTGIYLAIIGEWQSMPLKMMVLLGFASLFLLLGYYFSIEAMRYGSVSFVSPFRYTLMIWALLLGYLVFGDTPDNLSIVGMLLVTMTGIFTLYREAQVGRRIS